MTKKYFQAKKHAKNPLAMIGKKHPNAKKNRIIMICVVIFFAGLGASAGITYLSDLFQKAPTTKVEQVVKSKEPSVKRVVKPLSDENFKGAKEYNFYTQLEERSLVIGGEERFGGIPLNNIHEPPMISLESTAQTAVHAVQKEVLKNNYVENIAPLVLESVNHKIVEPKHDKVVALQVGSFSLNTDAQKHQQTLQQHGFTSKILKGMNNVQKDVYRVYLGPFSRTEVEPMKKKLSALNISYFEVK